MTFSPENDFGSVPPASTGGDDFDKKWNIDGLSLEGDETAPAGTAGVEAQPEPTLEELGEMYKVSETPKVLVEDAGGVVGGWDLDDIDAEFDEFEEGEETPVAGVEEEESSAVSNETKSREGLEQGVFDNPYNLSTEATYFDEYGLEHEPESSFSQGQREALNTIFKKKELSDLNYFDIMGRNQRLSDYRVMKRAVSILKEKMLNFDPDIDNSDSLRGSYLAMRKAFPDFKIGERIAVRGNDRTITYYE